MIDSELKKTRLHEWHVANGAKMGAFAGWDMPLYYRTGAVEEHRMVRRSAGLFDIGHMGRFVLSGPNACVLLDRALSNSIADIPLESSRYALMCRKDGGILDDVFVYHLANTPKTAWLSSIAGSLATDSADFWFVVVNAGTRSSDLLWLQQLGRDSGGTAEISITDVSEQIYMIALQGPNALSVLDAMAVDKPTDISRFGSAPRIVAGAACLICRTGYTGEDGVEIYCPADHALKLWSEILRAAADDEIECGPVGLAARDSLRFEPGFALYGHEINESTTPAGAGLKWACDFRKPFVGREAIQSAIDAGLPRKLVTLKMIDPGVPREGFEVLGDSGRGSIGKVVSGIYSPTLDGYYANAYVEPPFSARGTRVSVEIRGRARAAEVVKRPIYAPSYR